MTNDIKLFTAVFLQVSNHTAVSVLSLHESVRELFCTTCTSRKPESSDSTSDSMMTCPGCSLHPSYAKKRTLNIINDQLLGTEHTKFVN